ncbi:MAG: 2-oxo acid dehydrogenase subunit E2 [Rhodomicrobium sp.]
MRNYVPVEVPRESANDDEVRLVQWLVKDGQEIEAGDAVCLLESSKATIECTAPQAGYIYLQREAGRDVPVGEVIALIGAEPKAPNMNLQARREAAPIKAAISADSEMKISAKALLLIEKHNIDAAVFAGIGLVREKHVQQHLESRHSSAPARQSGEFRPHSPIQLRTAKVLVQAKQTIPHSYLSRHVDAGPVDANVEEIGTSHDIMLSVSDLLIMCVAEALAGHPKVNATWTEEGLRLHDKINVGFALNQTDGTLIVPVIKHANERGVIGIAGAVKGFQKKSLRGKLTAEDLTGGHCTVTSLAGSGVHQVIPIIYPDQSLIVAIADKWGHGAFSFYTVTVAYDHRILNGTEAASFLTTVSEGLLRGR